MKFLHHALQYFPIQNTILPEFRLKYDYKIIDLHNKKRPSGRLILDYISKP